MSAFDDLDAFVALPRLSSLTANADGTRLIATVSTRSDDRKRFVSALWEIDPAGVAAPRRLTRSAAGETAVVAGPDGNIFFVSKRPGTLPDDDSDVPALWVLPPVGEARRVASRPGGISDVAVAADAGTIVVASPTLAASTDGEDDKARRKAREEAGVSAVLHSSSPVRHWDHDLGPDAVRLLVVGADAASGSDGVSTDRAGDGVSTDRAGDPAAVDALLELRDLTPAPGRALDNQSFVLTPDGRTVITGWAIAGEVGYPRDTIIAIDVATGDQRVLASDPELFFADPQVSPDGRWIACRRSVEGGYDEVPDQTLWLLPIDGGEGRDLLPDDELWPSSYQWAADSSALFVTADQNGRAPVFRVGTDGGVTRLAADGHYTSLAVTPEAVFALRDRIDCPPVVVRLDPTAAEQTPAPLPAPGGLEVPGRVEDVDVAVSDGTRVRGWLVVPEAASPDAPAPLLLWIHGGPVSSWNSWSWRWNPWLMAAKGYAVLLPDPALSTGYGRDMVRRGWGQWGGAPYDDLMAITDAVVERPDIDGTRTAAMGGSYGGYMANWVAGHTDRFRCIVTHASLWALDQFAGTTDMPAFWLHEFGDPVARPERYVEFSPHRFLDRITTPMLVIHGDRDYRVPIGEGLRLWWDLQRSGVESKFLYYPDENHWILKPGDSKLWYATVLAWLGQHVLGEEWSNPELV